MNIFWTRLTPFFDTRAVCLSITPACNARLHPAGCLITRATGMLSEDQEKNYITVVK